LLASQFPFRKGLCGFNIHYKPVGGIISADKSRNSLRAQPMSAFPLATQRAFRINCGDLFAATAILAIGTCLLWAQSRRSLQGSAHLPDERPLRAQSSRSLRGSTGSAVE